MRLARATRALASPSATTSIAAEPLVLGTDLRAPRVPRAHRAAPRGPTIERISPAGPRRPRAPRRTRPRRCATTACPARERNERIATILVEFGGRRMTEVCASGVTNGSRLRQASTHRPATGERRDARHAALEEARAPRLRVGPALVRRLCDRVRTRCPRRRLGECRSPRPTDLRRHRGAARDRRPFLPADGARLRDERRSICGRARQSGPLSRAFSRRPPSSSTTCSRLPSRSPRESSLSPPPCRPSRRTRSLSRSLCVVLLTLANLRGVRESGILFALADVRIRGGHVRPRRDRSRRSAPPAPARRRTSPIRRPSASAR